MSTDFSKEMVTLSEDFVLPGAPSETWPLLSDPTLVASCIPGATLDKQDGNGRYRGTVKVKFGPTVVMFRGEVELVYDNANRTCVIKGRGVDQRGQSRANASGLMTMTGTDTSAVKVQGGFTLTGPLEAFARTGGVHIARALLAEFVANMTKLVESRRPAAQGDSGRDSGADSAAVQPNVAAAPSSSPSSPPPSPAATLSAFKIFRLALAGWFRNLFKS